MHFCLHSQAYQARATNDTQNCAIPQLIMGKIAQYASTKVRITAFAKNTQNSARGTQDATETNGQRLFF